MQFLNCLIRRERVSYRENFTYFWMLLKCDLIDSSCSANSKKWNSASVNWTHFRRTNMFTFNQSVVSFNSYLKILYNQFSKGVHFLHIMVIIYGVYTCLLCTIPCHPSISLLFVICFSIPLLTCIMIATDQIYLFPFQSNTPIVIYLFSSNCIKHMSDTFVWWNIFYRIWLIVLHIIGVSQICQILHCVIFFAFAILPFSLSSWWLLCKINTKWFLYFFFSFLLW